MLRRVAVSMFAVAVAALTSPQGSAQTVQVVNPVTGRIVTARSDRILVMFHRGVSTAAAERVHAAMNCRARVLPDGRLWVVSVPPGITVSDLVAAYQRQPGVAVAEPDGIKQVVRVPNDPGWPYQWGPDRIGCPHGWDTMVGAPSTVIAILDTGVDRDHEDLQGAMWTNPGEVPGNEVDDDQNGYIDDVHGWDFAYDDNNPADVHGHGTHCAGIAAGRTNNGMGIAGVAGGWGATVGCRIMAVKVLNDDGYGWDSDIIEGIEYAADMGAKVISMSLGGDYTASFWSGIEYAWNRDCCITVALGNSDTEITDDPGTWVSPVCNDDADPMAAAARNCILGVWASNSGDYRARFSNYSASPSNHPLADHSLSHFCDVGAPGVYILSTLPNNNYDRWSGTSMATPHVAGVCGLLRAANPGWSNAQVYAWVRSNCEPMDANNPLYAGKLGMGRVSLVEATRAPDLWIRKPGDPLWLGNDIYNTDGSSQTRQQTVDSGVTATYEMTLQNDGNRVDSFRVTGPAGGAGWAVSYQTYLSDASWRLVVQDHAGADEGQLIQWQLILNAGGPDTRTYASADTPLPIMDYETTTSQILVTEPLSITDVNVFVHIQHTWIGDLTVDLVSPAGTTVRLHNRSGGNAQDIVRTYDDEDPANLPAQPLSAFDGQSAAGPTMDITSDVTGTGWLSPALAPGQTHFLKALVTPDATVPGGSAKDLLVMATSSANSAAQDAVRAITSRSGGGGPPPAAPVMNEEPPFTAGLSNHVSWGPVADATEYWVEWSTTSAPFAPVGNSGWIAGTSHVASPLADGQTYFYRAAARNANGTSAWSNVVSSTQDATAPASTVNPISSPQNDPNFMVAWTAGDATSGVAYTRLYYSFNGGPYLQFEGDFTGTSTLFTSPLGNGTYAFYTRATDNVGNQEAAPQTPDQTVIVGPNNNLLTWNPVTRNLKLGDTDVSASGWFNLSTPAGAQVYVQVTRMGNTRIRGVFSQYDATGGSHSDAVRITTNNYLDFNWQLRNGVLYRLSQTSFIGRTVQTATYYQSTNSTRIGSTWKTGAWELTHTFSAPNTITRDNQQFFP